MIKKIIPLAFLNFFSSANAIEVTIKTEPADLWSKAERDYVQEAAKKAFEAIARADVANCAYRNSFREKSRDQLREKWGNEAAVINKSGKANLIVYKKALPQHVQGEARVGIAKVDRSKYEVLNLAISLSEELLNKHVKEYSKNSHSDERKNRWVNVITHEIAHNFGFNHGAGGGNWTIDYPGYFVTEIGFCAMTDGKYGSDLGDEKLRRELKEKFKEKT